SLQQEQVIEVTILLDLRSQLAAQAGEQFQKKLISKSLVSLLISQFHSTMNPPFTEVMRRVGMLSPFAGISVASSKIAAGKSPAGWGFLRKLHPETPERGKGDLNSALIQSKTATRH